MTVHAAAGDGLWAVTAFFNPSGYQRRIENFRIFRRHLGVRLLAVELRTPGRDWDLRDEDADRVVRCPDGDVLWQKERLLNIGVAALPQACQYVAWIDADVLFESEQWSRQAMAALEHASLVQLFSEVHDLLPGVLTVDWAAPQRQAWRTRPSVVAEIARGRRWGDFMQRGFSASAGMAWAAPRALLARHGLYDRCITGGGDNAILSAALGQPESLVARHRMPPQARSAYLEWARAFHGDVRGRVDWLRDHDVAHLWHGTRANRQLDARHRLLGEHDFDPAHDLALSPCGSWVWASDKPGLHEGLRHYFDGRREDEITTPSFDLR